jgi:uncharacterized protein YjbJ (UPF0337 family)
MEQNRSEGAPHGVKGTVKKVTGKIPGNKSREVASDVVQAAALHTYRMN